MMNEKGQNEYLALVNRVHPDFRGVWERRDPKEQASLAAYFLPRKSGKQWLEPTRPRVIKWYCPFAAQSTFPSGHRYCINTYVGCAHNCVYCYANAYTADRVASKDGFRKMVDKDMADLECFNVPPAPVHLSNSTDPLQEGFETTFRHTRYALEQILTHRKRFTTVAILTKNPALVLRDGYVDLLGQLNVIPSEHPMHEQFAKQCLTGFQIEVSLAFWREEARQFYDPYAPSVDERKDVILRLREAGIPVVLRIDPLFPRSPLPTEPTRNLADFSLAEAQTIEDLQNLVAFGKKVGVRHVVYSPVKIVQPRRRKMGEAMVKMKSVYCAMSAPGKPIWRGGSFRLPKEVADREVVAPFLRICADHGVKAKFCMTNLIETP